MENQLAIFKQIESGVSVLEFWSPTCSPCKMVRSTLEDLKQEFRDAFQLIHINVFDDPETAFKFRVVGLPTVLIFKDGEPMDALVTTYPKETYKTRIEKCLETKSH